MRGILVGRKWRWSTVGSANMDYRSMVMDALLPPPSGMVRGMAGLMKLTL